MCVWLLGRRVRGGAWASDQRANDQGPAMLLVLLPFLVDNQTTSPPRRSHTTICLYSACHNGVVVKVKAVVWHAREEEEPR